MSELLTPEPSVIRTYQPSAKQQLFHGSGAKYRLILGAWGAGKTTLLVWEDIMLALEHPGSLGVVYRKTYPALRDTTKRDYLAACPPELIADETKSEGREEIEFVNGSKTLFRCLDDFRKLGSTQFDRISIDEAWEVSEDEFRTLAYGRLRGKVGPRRMVLASNPPNRDTWMYKFFVTEATDDTVVFHFSTYDNAAHLPEGYVAKLETMPELWKKKFLRGEWGILVKGTPVFSSFREDLHVAKLRPVPGVPIARGWDFGFRHPACVWLQVLSTGHVQVLAEMLGQDEDLYQFGREVLALSERRFPNHRFEDYVDAYMGPQRTANVRDATSAVEVLRHEFKLLPRYRRYGIQESILKMQQMMERIPGGRALIQLDTSCKLLADALGGGYVYAPAPQDGPPKDLEPKKDGYYDNLVDAFRYALAPSFMPVRSPLAGKRLPNWRVGSSLNDGPAEPRVRGSSRLTLIRAG